MTLSKDNFPVGTRVRVVAFKHEITNPQVGTLGVVIEATYPRSTPLVFVRRDGRPDGDEFPFHPSELEVVAVPSAAVIRAKIATLTGKRDDLANQMLELADQQFVLDGQIQILTDALTILGQTP